MIYEDLTDLIGATPLLEVSGYDGQLARLILKLEFFNPGGSAKDRIALSMIEDAEANGLLKPGSVIIEPTSGNTGIGLAWVGKAKGYKVILTMPETMSLERRKLLKALGAELILTPGSEGMKGAIAKAEELHKEFPESIIPGQFTNPANPAVHERTTGEEIWWESGKDVDIFVAGVGTGGTISGVGKALKNHNPSIKIVAVEPATKKHGIQGIGAGFVPDTYDRSVVDSVMKVTDAEAFAGARMLAAKEGILVGISSGAAFSAALSLARLPENADKMIVALMPDRGERYLSTNLFDYE